MKPFSEIEQFLRDFEPISLEGMDSVKLLNRSERKYVLHFSRVAAVLEKAIDTYSVLEINGHRLLEYITEYFDTADNAMYLAHHSGMKSRYKVRKREYVVSGEQYLEVKKRTLSGRTQKKRIELNGSEMEDSGGQLVEAVTPYKLDGLEMKLTNSFKRITLVNTKARERVTIDIGLEFRNRKKLLQLPSIAIIEIKSLKSESPSGLEHVLQSLRIKGSSVSKYCIGRALLEPELKANLFRNKIRYLVKLNAIPDGSDTINHAGKAG